MVLFCEVFTGSVLGFSGLLMMTMVLGGGRLEISLTLHHEHSVWRRVCRAWRGSQGPDSRP